jgi:uncharacterized surface protein with fasciclin (FAS1) repeats
MKRKLLTLLVLSTVATSAAYAGSGPDYMRGTDQQKTAMMPAVMTQSYGYHASDMRVSQLPEARAMYAMSHGGGSSKSMASEMPSADIVDTAVAAGSFNTLVEAVKAADLVGTLKGKGPFTVFAPTDEAFAKLPEGTLEGLLADKAKLVKVLTYHVVPGKVMSSDLAGVASLKTVEGSDLMVADIQVSSVDIATSNGVIHVVNEVLIPQM